MKTVSISKFRANLLEYLKKVQQGQELVITSNGEILAAVSPPGNPREQAREALDRLAKSAVIQDIVSPINEPWNAAQ